MYTRSLNMLLETFYLWILWQPRHFTFPYTDNLSKSSVTYESCLADILLTSQDKENSTLTSEFQMRIWLVRSGFGLETSGSKNYPIPSQHHRRTPTVNASPFHSQFQIGRKKESTFSCAPSGCFGRSRCERSAGRLSSQQLSTTIFVTTLYRTA